MRSTRASVEEQGHDDVRLWHASPAQPEATAWGSDGAEAWHERAPRASRSRHLDSERHAPNEGHLVRQGEVCWLNTGFFHDSWRGRSNEGERAVDGGVRSESNSGMPSALRGGCGPMLGAPQRVDR